MPLPWPFQRARPQVEPAHELADEDLVVLVDSSLDSRLVVYQEPRSFPAEQYRSFRTNLRAMNPGDSPRTLLFTSAIPDEGKSTTVANIALSLAEFDTLRVCLVDMDLRAPHMHELFGVDRGPGLTDVLLDRKDPGKVFQSGGMPNLKLLTAGRATNKTAEVMGSSYVQDLFAHLKSQFNYIIVDTPPCSLFADAAELSKIMDGCVLVVSLRETHKHQAEDALGMLDQAGANVVGTFVTGTQTDFPTVVADVSEV